MAQPRNTTAVAAQPAAPQSDADAALAALAEVDRLSAENASLREDLAAQKRRFDLSWAEREERHAKELDAAIDERNAAADRIAAEERGVNIHRERTHNAPFSGRVVTAGKRVARNTIHCLSAKGEPLTVLHGKSIPDDADLTGVNPSAISEEPKQ